MVLTNYLINGNSGPYKTNTQAGCSANAGYKFANLSENDLWQLKNSNIKYSNIFCNGDDSTINTNATLAYSTEALKGLDKNDNGSVSVSEVNNFYYSKLTSRDPDGPHLLGAPDPDSIKVGNAIDINSDGKVDKGEWSAWMIYQDGQEGLSHIPEYIDAPDSRYNKALVDGKVTTAEAMMAESEANANPNAVKAKLQEIYNDNNIEETEDNFKMPPKKTDNTGYPRNNNNMMQLLMMLLQMMMGGSGGFGGLFGGLFGFSTNSNSQSSSNPFNSLPGLIF